MTQRSQLQSSETLIETPSAEKEYSACIAKTIACVQKALREIYPQANDYPSDIDCYSLAVVISIARVCHNKRWADLRKNRGKPKISPLISAAKKFQRELTKSRAELVATIPPEIITYYETDLKRMDTAQQSVAALLENYKRPEPYNSALEIGRLLIEAWRRAGIKILRGVKPGDPFCKAVTKLLELGGINYGPDYVSDLLRERAQRPRSGRAQNDLNRAPKGAQKQRKRALRPI